MYAIYMQYTYDKYAIDLQSTIHTYDTIVCIYALYTIPQGN